MLAKAHDHEEYRDYRDQDAEARNVVIGGFVRPIVSASTSPEIPSSAGPTPPPEPEEPLISVERDPSISNCSSLSGSSTAATRCRRPQARRGRRGLDT
ncbi:hypothetical protein D8S78_00375 [Natrialba swarupiae]|nr:hypothetical protein [Natrialba swarupiae]